MQKIKILAISMSLVTLVGMTSGLTGCGETETETSEVLELSDDETMVVEALQKWEDWEDDMKVTDCGELCYSYPDSSEAVQPLFGFAEDLSTFKSGLQWWCMIEISNEEKETVYFLRSIDDGIYCTSYSDYVSFTANIMSDYGYSYSSVKSSMNQLSGGGYYVPSSGDIDVEHLNHALAGSTN